MACSPCRRTGPIYSKTVLAHTIPRVKLRANYNSTLLSQCSWHDNDYFVCVPSPWVFYCWRAHLVNYQALAGGDVDVPRGYCFRRRNSSSEYGPHRTPQSPFLPTWVCRAKPPSLFRAKGERAQLTAEKMRGTKTLFLLALEHARPPPGYSFIVHVCPSTR